MYLLQQITTIETKYSLNKFSKEVHKLNKFYKLLSTPFFIISSIFCTSVSLGYFLRDCGLNVFM